MHNLARTIRFIGFLAIGLVLSLSCGPSIIRVAEPSPSGSIERSRPKLRALLIGVDYEIADLPEGRNDLKFLRDTYQIAHWIHSLDSCAEIKILTGSAAKKAEIIKELPWLYWNNAVANDPSGAPLKKEEKISVFYFSGHGKLSQRDNNQGFIIPYDGLHEANQNGGQREELMISPEELFNRGDKWNSLSLFILDSCNSGIFASYLEGKPYNEHIRIMTASLAEQASLSPPERYNSLFTQALYKSLLQLSSEATLDEIVLSTRARLHGDPIWQSNGYKPEPAYSPLLNRMVGKGRIPFYKTKPRTECEVPTAAVRDISQTSELNVTVDATSCTELMPGTKIGRFMNREDNYKKPEENGEFVILQNKKTSNTQCDLRLKPTQGISAEPILAIGDLLLRKSVSRDAAVIKVYISKECESFARQITENCHLCDNKLDRREAEYALERSALHPTAPGDRPGEHSRPSPGPGGQKGCAWRRVQTLAAASQQRLLPDSLSPKTTAEELNRDIERIYNLKFWQALVSENTMAPWKKHRDVFPYYANVALQGSQSEGRAAGSDAGFPASTIKLRAGTPYQIDFKQVKCERGSCDRSQRRHVYVCSIDSSGEAELLFPNNTIKPFMQSLLPSQNIGCDGCSHVLLDKVMLERKEVRLIVAQARMEPYSDPNNACTAFRQELTCKDPIAALRLSSSPADLLDTFIIAAE